MAAITGGAARAGGTVGAAIRGAGLAFATAPALVLSFAITAAIASAAAAPAAASLRAALDRRPGAALLTWTRDASSWERLGLSRPALAGDAPFSAGSLPGSAFRQEGALGGFLVLALANAAVASVLSGGLAARFAASRERSSLPAFAADAVRFAPGSLAIGALSLGILYGLYHLLVTLPGRFFAQSIPRYEWESVLPRALCALLFLLLVALARSTLLGARAAMGLSGSGNPLAALGTGLGLVVRRPASVLALELLFAATAIGPTVAWFAFAPVLPGWQGALVDLLGQQSGLFLATASRAAHLGAVQSLVAAGGAPVARTARSSAAAPSAVAADSAKAPEWK